MTILAIETSCDESAMALVQIEEKDGIPKPKVLKSLIASQIAIHAPFGGVVPNLAKREHLKNLPLLWEKIRKHPLVKRKNIDLLVVTVGPGLEPALWTGIDFAKSLHADFFEKKIPLVGANHLEGHAYSFLLSMKGNQEVFPMVSLVVSGGHTILGTMRDAMHFKKLGETKDDAVGECFDKVARLLGLPYPGGPRIEKLAKGGNDKKIPFPSPMLNQKNFDFSYSGLKTAVLYYLRDHAGEATQKDVAASFQRAAFHVLVQKTMRALDKTGATSVSMGGGVAANKTLREKMKKEMKKIVPKGKLFTPPLAYCMDNAVMIALAGYIAYAKKKKYPLRADGTLSL